MDVEETSERFKLDKMLVCSEMCVVRMVCWKSNNVEQMKLDKILDVIVVNIFVPTSTTEDIFY